MRLRRWHLWLLGMALTAWLQGRAGASRAEPPRDQPAPREVAVSSCTRREDVRRVLARTLGELSVHDEAVGSVAAKLQDTYHVPLSFIENDEDVKVSFSISQATVQGVLEKIVERAPAYRYFTIAGRLVLYPRSTKWDARLEAVHLGPGPRDQVASQLAAELERRLPAFAKFGVILAGDSNSYVYRDLVSVTGTGSVIELLVQLLGARPAVVFSIYKLPGWTAPQLYLSGLRYWQSVKLTSPTAVMHPGEKVQVKVMGLLLDGSYRDVTAGACSTVYQVSDENVITVSTDGLVTARGTGEAWVRAENGDQAGSLSITVAKPVARAPGNRYALISGRLVLYKLSPQSVLQAFYAAGRSAMLREALASAGKSLPSASF
jgi:hypothetical protein